MAIIYSYPKNINLLASDLLVGTSTAIVAGKKKNQTKSFSLGDLSNYVISNIPVVTGYVPYIGAISDINIGNNSIYTSGGAKVWDDGTIEGASFQFAGYLGSLQSAASTNVAWTLPNKSGTIALLDDIPLIPASFGLYAQTALSTPIVYASGEASLIGAGVGTLSVPANAFKVGDSFVAKMCGNLTNANNEQIHFRVRSNGVIIIDALQYTLATATNKYFDLILDFTVSKIGGAGVAELMANGVFTYNKNASNAIEGINFGKISNTVFDTTVTNTLTITAEWVTSSATNTIRSQNFTLTKVY